MQMTTTRGYIQVFKILILERKRKKKFIFHILILICNDFNMSIVIPLSVQNLITFQVAEKFPEIITHFRTSFWNCSVPPFISRWAPIKAWKYKNPHPKNMSVSCDLNKEKIFKYQVTICSRDYLAYYRHQFCYFAIIYIYGQKRFRNFINKNILAFDMNVRCCCLTEMEKIHLRWLFAFVAIFWMKRLKHCHGKDTIFDLLNLSLAFVLRNITMKFDNNFNRFIKCLALVSIMNFQLSSQINQVSFYWFIEYYRSSYLSSAFWQNFCQLEKYVKFL